jgi:acetyl esterase/lipase
MAPPLTLDREFAAAVAAAGELAAAIPQLPAGDVKGRREWFDAYFGKTGSMMPRPAGITTTVHHVKAADGATIELTELRPASAPKTKSPAIYHMHGGGMILGSVKQMSPFIALRAEGAGLPVFSIEYRLAPEHQHPTPVNDCYAGLEWLSKHAEELGVDNTRILVLGESAGGGLAAGTTLMARDKGLSPPIAYQMLIYPMLDDRNVAKMPAVEGLAMWKAADNETGWGALLGSQLGTSADVEGLEYSAPARAKSLAGLPPTYIDVGQLDIFAPEDMEYAKRLIEAGVQTEFHLYPGLPHAFEGLGVGTAIGKSAMGNRQRVINEFKRGEEEVEVKAAL